MQIKTQNATSQSRQLMLLDVFPFYFPASAWNVQKQMEGITDVRRNKEIFVRHSHMYHTEGHMEMRNSVLTAIN